METLYIFLLLVLFLYLNQQFVLIKQKLAEQREQLLQLRNDLLSPTATKAPPPERSPVDSALAEPKSVSPTVPPGTSIPSTVPTPPPVQPDVARPDEIPALKPVLSISAPEPPKPNLLDESLLETPEQARSSYSTQRVRPVTAPAGPSWFRRFLNENPDLEKFIGENLINKIGIAILVAGIGYFVRYAIAQEWIGEVGRVLIGLVAGGGLLAVAHRMRQRFAAFSSVLVAGGLSVLYFTIAIAFADYKLFSQTAAFGIMVIITGLAIALAIAYDRVELAVMSLIGGFATPFIVSTGAGNYLVLFTYILILDVGMLVLSSQRRWPLVHWVAYGFTGLLYGSWLTLNVFDYTALPGTSPPPYLGVLAFGTAFYALFTAMTLFDRLRHRSDFTAPDLSLFISNTALYYGAGMGLLAYVAEGSWQGPFTLALAVLNFGYAALLRRRNPTATTLFYLLIGLVVTFASLTIPVQLDGNFITMFWALEAVLLLWLSQRSGLRLMATASVIVQVLMSSSLLIDWSELYSVNTVPALPILLNKAFVTSLVAVIALVAYQRLLARQELPIPLVVGEIPIPAYRQFMGYVVLIIGYLAGFLEVNYQLLTAYGLDPNRAIGLGTYNLLVTNALLMAALRFATSRRLWAAVSFAGLVLFIYVVQTGPAAIELTDEWVQGLIDGRPMLAVQYVNLLGVALLLTLLFRAKHRLAPTWPLLETGWPWLLVFVVVTVSSMALFATVSAFQFTVADIAQTTTQRLAIQDRYDALMRQTNKVGLPILWGVCAFAFMYVGLVRRNRMYRILSLALFALTLLKLFLYDIRGISEGGRILAFISLGALLLVISFMYQRIKRLLLADENA